MINGKGILMKKALFILIFTFFGAYLFSQPNYYVSTSGNDSHSGSESQPYKTIAHALAEMASDAPSMTGDLTLYIYGGDYFLPMGIEFDANLWGRSSHRIIISNYNNQKVNLYGGTPLSSWALYRDSIYRSYVVVGKADFVIENLVQSIFKNDMVEQLVDFPSEGNFCYKDDYLYYQPHNSQINSQSIIIPQLPYIFKIGSLVNAFSNITIRGLNFIGTASSEKNNDDNAMIVLENVKNIEISNCQFIGSGSNGLLAKGSVQNLVIQNNRIDQVLLNGILLQGFHIGNGLFTSPAASYVNKGNRIINNVITFFGRNGQNHGIDIFQSGDNEIRSNTISRGSGSGIFVAGDGSALMNKLNQTVYGTVLTKSTILDYLNSKGNRISGNRIYNTSQNLSGGIRLNFAGRNNIVENNRISNIDSNTSIDAYGSGIYLGEWINGAVIRNNIIHDVHDYDENAAGIIVSSPNVHILNNILALNDDAQDFLFEEKESSVNNIEMQRNLIYSPSGNYVYNIKFPILLPFSTINNNFIYHPGGEYKVKSSLDEFSFSEWKNRTNYDRDSRLTTNPLFVELTTGDFKVESGSLALNTGFVNIDQAATGVSSSYSFYFAKDKLEAEKARTNMTQNATTLSLKSSTGYFYFENLQLESHLRNVEVRYSKEGDSTESMLLEIREGGPMGSRLASLALPGTGSINRFTVVDAPVSLDQKVSTLYFMLQGSSSQIKIDWLSFYETESNVESDKKNRPPVVEFVKPVSGDFLKKSSSIMIKGRAYENDGGSIDEVLLFIDDSKEGFSVVHSGNGFYEYSWQNPEPGKHSLTLKATDNEGAVSSETIEIEVDDEDFSFIKITSPEQNKYFASSSIVTIEAESSSSVTISKIEILLNGAGPIYSVENQDSISYEWEAALTGQLLFEVVATDDQGNTSKDSVSILVGSEANLLLHWKLDDIIGDQTMDSSPSEPPKDGYVTGGQITRGALDGAVMIDGMGYIRTNDKVIKSSGRFTVAGWIKPRTLRGGQYLFGQPNVIDIRFASEATIKIITPNKSMNLLYEYKPEEWHHLAVINDSSFLSFYIDGNLVKQSQSNSQQNLHDGLNAFYAGGYDSKAPGAFNYEGAFDDIRVYDIALSDYELKMISSIGDNLRPSVSLLSPEDGAQFVSPREIVVKVFADDSDGEVTSVQFYIDDDLAFTDDEPEYYYSWTNITPGVHIIKVVATDNEGLESQDSITVSVSATSDRLIAHWSFDEGSGSYVHDSSGNNNSGTIYGADYKPGVTGTALNFSGKDYVKTKPGIMNGLTSFTILGWINPQETNNTSGLWGQNGIAQVGLDASSLVKLETGNGNSISAMYPWPTDGWHHVTVVGTGDDLYLFLDGKLVMNGGNSTESYGINKMPFNIGGNVLDLTGDYFTGLIDELYVYGRALTTEEIKKHIFSVDKILPEIKIVSPSSGSRYNNAGGAILFQTVVKGNGAIISKVELYANDKLVGTADTEPYNVIWEDYGAENYTIRARAVTDQEMWAEDKIYISVIDPEADTDHGPSDSTEDKNSGEPSSDGKNSTSGKSKGLLVTVEQKKLTEGGTAIEPGATPRPLIFLQENTPLPGRFLVDQSNGGDEAENFYNKIIADNGDSKKGSQVTNDNKNQFIDSNQQKQLMSQNNRNNEAPSSFPWFWLIPAIVLVAAAIFLVIKSKTQKNDRSM